MKATRHGAATWAAAAWLAVAGCAGPGPEGSGGEGAGGTAGGGDLLVSTAWLAEHLDDPGVVVVQVGRDRAAYEEGHIPGARFLELSRLVVERDGVPNELPAVAALDSAFEAVGVGDDARVVLYGDMGGLSAARAFFTLEYLGHSRVSLLDGGLEQWRAEGRPVTTEAPAVEAATLTPRPRPELVVDAAWVRARLEEPGVALVDARPPAQYTGEEAGEGIARGGHIPGAGNFFWRDALVSEERPVLKDRDALRARFAEAGVDEGDVVVAYCRTGVMASLTYFVARYLGYEARIYDGSFIEWSRRGDLPVAVGTTERG
jgi:thiosulfate/3-mercaptopyruvate sulfurtransferase